MRYFNLAPHVLCTTAKNRVLKKDIEGGFPENWWPEGEVDKQVEDGFLVEINPAELTVPTKKVEKEDSSTFNEVDGPESSDNTPEFEESSSYLVPEDEMDETFEETHEEEETELEESESDEENENTYLPKEEVPYAKWTETALKDVLTMRGVSFDPDAKKPELWRLYKEK